VVFTGTLIPPELAARAEHDAGQLFGSFQTLAFYELTLGQDKMTFNALSEELGKGDFCCENMMRTILSHKYNVAYWIIKGQKKLVMVNYVISRYNFYEENEPIGLWSELKAPGNSHCACKVKPLVAKSQIEIHVWLLRGGFHVIFSSFFLGFIASSGRWALWRILPTPPTPDLRHQSLNANHETQKSEAKGSQTKTS